jgi:DNA-binding NtrC family response regulator
MESESKEQSALPTGRDVLVVEDEERVRNMLSRALKELGFHGTFASTAESAKKAVAARQFDILILDLNLPGMGGMEFLEKVRQTDKDVQVIVLTGFGDLESARKAIHLDVVEFLTKPCPLGLLESALAKAQKRRKSAVMIEASESVQPKLQFEIARSLSPASPVSLGPADSMEHVEYQHILAVLQRHNGNRGTAATELGISVRKLYYRLGEYQRQGLLPENLKYRPR